MDGLLVIDKPEGITSRAALDRVKAWLPAGTRVGHTGTLDPLATGVLVVCVGVATRLAEYVQAMGKVYRAGIRLGATSDTDDADGSVTAVAGARTPDPEELRRTLAGFVGAIEQVPPDYSAAKVSGRRAYKLARKGTEVSLAPRTVRVDAIEVLRYEYPHLDIEVRCGKGTYIRSLARDLGERLGCGGLIDSLRRTRVGPFVVEGALSIAEKPARIALLPVASAVSELPAVRISEQEERALRQGKVLPWDGMAAEEGAMFVGERLAGIGCSQGGVLKVVRMLVYGD